MKELEKLKKRANMTKFIGKVAKAESEYIPTMVVKEPDPTKKIKRVVESELMPSEKEDILAEEGARRAFDQSMEEARQEAIQEEIERKRKKREEEEELESVR